MRRIHGFATSFRARWRSDGTNFGQNERPALRRLPAQMDCYFSHTLVNTDVAENLTPIDSDFEGYNGPEFRRSEAQL